MKEPFPYERIKLRTKKKPVYNKWIKPFVFIVGMCCIPLSLFAKQLSSDPNTQTNLYIVAITVLFGALVWLAKENYSMAKDHIVKQNDFNTEVKAWMSRIDQKIDSNKETFDNTLKSINERCNLRHEK